MIIVIVMSRLSVRFPSGTLGTDSSIQTEQHSRLHQERFVATFRVARATSQTRKLWLVGVATDRDAPVACLNVKNLSKNEKKRKQKKKNKKKQGKETHVKKGGGGRNATTKKM